MLPKNTGTQSITLQIEENLKLIYFHLGTLKMFQSKRRCSYLPMNKDSSSWSLAKPLISVWACSPHFSVVISLSWAALSTFTPGKGAKKENFWLQIQWRKTVGKTFTGYLNFSTFCLLERKGTQKGWLWPGISPC